MSTVALRAVRKDGTVVDIVEADLYRYTRERWIFNEEYNVSARYLKFNLQNLLQVAINALHDKGARVCTEVLKCKEGLNNKAYLLKMDNGSVVFAKLPNPCAGPAFYTTASEVATRSFLREEIGLPIPRILAWSSKADNPVGAEYILEEIVSGEPLSKFWGDWEFLPMKPRVGIIEQIVELERKLALTTFKQYGCIYFKEDYPQGDTLAAINPITQSGLEIYAMGPLVEKNFWHLDKTTPSEDCGPYSSALEFVRARGRSERKYVEAEGQPRMNYALSTTEPEQPQDMLDLLDRYQQLALAMILPPTPKDQSPSTIWHLDLHLENVFVDPSTMQITSIIDWQSVAAVPFFYTSGVPKMFRHREPVSLNLNDWPKLPDNYNDLQPDEQEYADNMLKSEQIHKLYLAVTHNHNPRHWTALQGHTKLRVQPVRIVQQAWKANNVCDEEIASFNQELEGREFVAGVLDIFQQHYGLPPEGTIDPARYDEMQAELADMKAKALDAAETEEERFRTEKLWPYQDTEMD